MATIYTRATKGSALTWTEGDANITNLNNDKIENVVEDTTPQLGGNLDVNGNSIVSASNGNIAITPNGTGSVVLDGLNWPQADGTNGQVLTTNGSGQLSFSTISSASGTVTSVSGTGTVNGLTLSGTVTSTGNLTLGGTLSLVSPPAIGGTTPNTGTFTTLTVNAANELRLADTDSSHYVGFKSPATVTTNRIWTLPAADGTTGQVLSTNGSGALSWATAGGGSGPSFAIVYLNNSDYSVSSTASNSNLFGVATLIEDTDINNIVSINGDNDIVLAAAGTYIYEVTSVPLFAINFGPGSSSIGVTSPTAYFNVFNNTTATTLFNFDLDSVRYMGNSNSITYKGNLGQLMIKTKIVTTSTNNAIRLRVTGQAASSGGSTMRFGGGKPITIKITKIA
jgi:hypothetical protein